MSKPKSVPLDQLSPQIQDLCEVLNTEDDMPCVLICASFLDRALETLLEKHLVKTSVMAQALSQSGWLGTYSARSDLAYGLGLITKGLYQNLAKVGSIRNRFAHSHLTMSFEDPKTVDLCRELTYPKATKAFSIGFEDGDEPPLWPNSDDARSRFTVIALQLVNRLILTGLGTERMERMQKGWE